MESCATPIVPNTDISGIGVRLSFYAQAVFLALLSTRSTSAYEAGNALATLVITNLAYAVTTVILGFRKQPDLSLYDGVVVMYLLTLSWLAVQFSLPQYNRFRYSDPVIKLLAILQSYVVLAATFAITIAAPHFGTRPGCNAAISAVIFAPFPFHKGRVAILVVLSLVTAAYTALIAYDYRVAGDYSPNAHPIEVPVFAITVGVEGTAHAVTRTVCALPPSHARVQEETRRLRRFSARSFHSPRFDGRIFVTVSLIVSFSVVGIINTELLIRHNLPIINNDGQKWSFGQILPLFLAILSMTNTIKAFVAHGCGPKPRRSKNQGSRMDDTTSG